MSSTLRNRCCRLLSVLLPALCLFAPGCGENADIPRGVKPAIEAGWTFFAVAEFERSEAAFNYAASAAAPGSPEYLMAKFGLANAYQHRKPTAKLTEAKAVYGKLATEDKGGEIGGWSALALARIDHMKLYDVDRPGGVAETTTAEYLFVAIILVAAMLGVVGAFLLKDRNRVAGLVVVCAAVVGGIELAGWAKEKATKTGEAAKVVANLPKAQELAELRKSYQRVMDEFPKTPAADEAAVFYGETMIELLAVDSIRQGIAYLKDWVDKHSDSMYVGAACSQMANGYEMLNMPKEQLQAMVKADDSNKDPLADHSWWYYRIAAVADRDAQEPEIAKKYYRLMLDRYPTDFRVFFCKQALKRLEGGGKTDAPLKTGAVRLSRDGEGTGGSRALTRAARLSAETGAATP